MQHDHNPKDLNFDLSSIPYVHPGDQTKGVKQKSHLICFISIVEQNRTEHNFIENYASQATHRD